MSQNSSQEMLDKFSGTYQQKIRKICEPFFHTFGVNHFFFQVSTYDGNFYGLGTNPEFMHDYLDQKMHECNPFLTNPEKLHNGLHSFNYVNGSDAFQSSMQFAQSKYKLKHSFIIMEKGLKKCTQFGFATDPKRTDAELLLINEMPLVYEFIRYFKGEMKDILKALRTCKIPIRKSTPRDTIIPEIQLDYEKRIDLLTKFKTPKMLLSYAKLSTRELDCLKLYLKGYSASEIGDDLDLSKRTVEFYIENIKDKLACHSKPELISLLLHMVKLGLYKELF